MRRPAFLKVPDLPRSLWLILAFAMLMRMAGPFWGLPSSDGWDNDGIAPRDVLVGIIETYRPGAFYIYPPLQHWILAILTLPVTLVVGLSLPSHDSATVISAFIHAQNAMTAYAAIARLVALAMSLSAMVFIWDWARRIFGDRAALFAAAAVALNQAFTYYGQTSNLDAPALFWITWAMRELALGKERLRRAFLLGMCAVATKDQAYAALILPFAVASLRNVTKAPEGEKFIRLRGLAIDAVFALAFLLLIDGAITNPVGFRARLLTLRGSASQEHAFFSANAAGWLAIASDLFARSDRNYPYLLAPFLGVGLAAAWKRENLFARYAPLLSALSFFLFFNLVARRTEHRFLMPEGVLVGAYYGIGLDWLLTKTEERRRVWARYLVLLGLAPGVFVGVRGVVAVPIAMMDDPRYQAEALLERELKAGDHVEVWGRQVYLPRIPSRAKTSRLDASDPKSRGTMPGYEELGRDFAAVEERKPRFLVVSEGWAFAYRPPPAWDHGRTLQTARLETFSDETTRTFVAKLFANETAYQPVFFSKGSTHFWGALDTHLSLNTPLWIFERKER